MEDVFSAAWRDQPAARNSTLEAELATLIDRYGLALIGTPDALRTLLTRSSPDAPHHIAAILAAATAGVPQRLQVAEVNAHLPALLQRSVRHLQQDTTLDAAWASWAVSVWAHALALPSSGLGAVTSAGALNPSKPDRAGLAPVPAPISVPPRIDGTEREPAVRVTRRPPATNSARDMRREGAPDTAAAGLGSLDAPTVFLGSLDAPTVFLGATNDDPTATLVDAAPPRRADGDLTARREPLLAGDEARAAERPMLAEPLFSENDLQRIGREARADAAQSFAAGAMREARGADRADDMGRSMDAADASSRRAALQAPADPRTPRMRTFPPPLVVGLSTVGVIFALILGIGIDAMWRAGPRRSAVPAVVATTSAAAAQRVTPSRPAGDPPVAVASSAGPVVASPADGSLANASPPNASVRPSAGPSIGPSTGPSSSPRPDEIAADKPASTAAGSGSPSVSPAATPTDAPARAATATTAPSSPPQLPARAAVPPQQATVSAPVAVDAGLMRPVIAQIAVPRVVEGAPFSVALRLASDGSDGMKVERRIVYSDGAWPPGGTAPQLVPSVRAGGRTLSVPFRAMDAPAHAIVAFTVIGRDGSRSEMKTADITVGDAPAVGASAATAATAAPTASALPASTASASSTPSTTTGPAASSSTTPASCTGNTCGIVVDAREVEPENGTRAALYEITVRMDDLRTRAFNAPYRLQAGSRVRLVGGRLVPAG